MKLKAFWILEVKCDTFRFQKYAIFRSWESTLETQPSYSKTW